MSSLETANVAIGAQYELAVIGDEMNQLARHLRRRKPGTFSKAEERAIDKAIAQRVGKIRRRVREAIEAIDEAFADDPSPRPPDQPPRRGDARPGPHGERTCRPRHSNSAPTSAPLRGCIPTCCA